MSRSRKKTPISGNANAKSDKVFKRQKAKARRRASDPVEKKDSWDSAKDGKHWFGGHPEEQKFRRK